MEIYKLLLCGLGACLLAVVGLAQALFFFVFKGLSTDQKELGKKLDNILFNQQAFVREKSCNADMQSHCNQINELLARVGKNESDIAALSTKVELYHK